MQRIRFIMVGGFLGAGKTTAIARLARHYMDSGHRVGLVTNDQAYGLVDTLLLRAQGFHVGEVPGACFCCKFDDLVETINRIQDGQRPNVIITEPVGSCTDLVATVIEPLRHLHGDNYEVAPLVVLLKPEHGQKILREQSGGGFSPKAAYIFLKQLEEANVVAINKIDKLTAAEQDELLNLVSGRFPAKQVIATSARSGDGFDALIRALETKVDERPVFMDVDYDVYAAGEAELGWLNCTLRLKSAADEAMKLDELAVDFVTRARDLLCERNAETAHLKALVQDDGGPAALANLVASDVDVELSAVANTQTRNASMTVNARVAISPEELEDVVHEALRWLSQRHHVSFEMLNVQRFRPARPVPTHRYTQHD